MKCLLIEIVINLAFYNSSHSYSGGCMAGFHSTTLLVKKIYYEKFLLATKKVLMKTVEKKDPANSDLSVLRVRLIFLLVNALVYVDIDLGNGHSLGEKRTNS